ncbi:MAG TPA: conjugal transfer protein TrbF [Paraburkholderia sp.]|uniref:conjugal transfer protein TrbF n=1 Tax=Paraburkholderia sp. TaxID=1926495 RepID=UPI002ED47E35
MSLADELLNEPMGRSSGQVPATPYTLARAQWDDRLGTLATNAKHWRLGFFGLLFACLSLTGGIVYAMTRSLVEPVVITVDKTTGVTNVVGKASAQAYTPQQAEIAYFLGHVVRLLRAVPLDPVVVRAQWNEAYRFMRQAAATKLNAWAREIDSPLSKVGQETVTLQLQSVLPISSDAYELRWVQSVYQREGALIQTTTWTATFTLEFEPPATEEDIAVNPLGIYIKDFEWHRDLTPSSR